jgi:hypothetical protein
MTSAEVIHYTGDAVGLKTTYSVAECHHMLLKRGQKISQLTVPRRAYYSKKLSAEKKKDVQHLPSMLRESPHVEY